MGDVHGFCDERFELLGALFRRNQDHGVDEGASLAVTLDGEFVVDLWGGERTEQGDPWEADTLAMCFSTTKGVASFALHLQVAAGLLGYDDPVAAHWPEFAQNGKDEVTVRHVLSHSAGLHRLRSVIDDASEMLDWDHMVDRLAREAPAYPPGTKTGYHALTYGWLAGELVPRVSGRPLGRVVLHDIAAPLGLEHFLALLGNELRDDLLDAPLEAADGGVDLDQLAALARIRRDVVLVLQLGLDDQGSGAGAARCAPGRAHRCPN